MAKELDPIAEAKFKQESMQRAYDMLIELKFMDTQTTDQLIRSGYGPSGMSKDEMIIRHMRFLIKISDKAAADHLRKQGD
jgi:hypothetical protein